MSNKQNRRSNGLGYYIALGLCAAAIGVCGFLYSRNPQDPQVTDPDQNVGGTLRPEDVPAVATKPNPTKPTQRPTEKPQEVKPTEKKAMKTASPVAGQTIGIYAMEALSYNQTTRDWRTHDGMDIAAEAGTQVCAAADGTVYTVYEDETMGMTVVISHQDGYTTRYSSLSQEVAVSPGEAVSVGQVIGTVGNSALLEMALGDHVHFAVSCDGASVDPMDFLALGE